MQGEILFRDDLQFELKSEFFPVESLKKNRHTQEFFLFIPKALGVDSTTYPKEQFFRDQTNLIRFKTPQFSFKELLNSANDCSPLSRLRLLMENRTEKSEPEIQEELKLLGNIVRSLIRDSVKELVIALYQVPETRTFDDFNHLVISFIRELELFRSTYAKLEENLPSEEDGGVLREHFFYVDEFISNAVNYYLTGLLEKVRNHGFDEIKPSDDALCDLLVVEGKIQQERRSRHAVAEEEDEEQKEFILYRRGLLNKFVLDTLLLSVDREAVMTRHANLIGSLAAALAMLFYLLLFIWQGELFVINSAPFVIITVLLYVVKDRIKEGLKVLYSQKALRWFSDYRTEIRSPSSEKTIGCLKEWFSFVREADLPREVRYVRNKEFHTELQMFKRPESVVYYKKQLTLYADGDQHRRRCELNNIFRFNIHRFLEKASNARGYYRAVDPDTRQISGYWLPKVYHLNIIMRNTMMTEEGKKKVEMKKFRLVLDKHGIKRVERVKGKS